MIEVNICSDHFMTFPEHSANQLCPNSMTDHPRFGHYKTNQNWDACAILLDSVLLPPREFSAG
jgi:hypothetical protein